MLDVTFSDIQKIVKESLEELFTKDGWLLEDNVSERAITQKFAEYLQKRIPYFRADCEYTRNATEGGNAPKRIRNLKGERKLRWFSKGREMKNTS